MSISNTLEFSWFRDAERNKPSCTTDLSKAELVRRPWRAHWPPRSANDRSVWLRCEFPQVLSWRFDPDKPFDRPWRYWARTVLAKQEEEDIQKELRSLLEEQGTFC